MPYKNKEDQQRCWREHYQRNKERYYLRNKEKRKKLVIFINDQKNKPCYDCGKSYPTYVMDFDHRDGKEKIMGVSEMVTNGGFSLEKVAEEIEKCDLVCANCHRIRTHNRMKNGERYGVV